MVETSSLELASRSRPKGSIGRTGKGRLFEHCVGMLPQTSLSVVFVDTFWDEKGYERAVKLKIMDNEAYSDSEDEELQKYCKD